MANSNCDICVNYVYDEEYQLYRDKKDDTAYMRNLIKKGEDLKIVGIAQAKEGTTAAMLTSGIYYPASLTNHVIEQAQNSEIVKAQLKTPEKNVFTGKRFDDKNSNDFNMESLFSINEALLQSAFGIDTSALSFDLDGLDEAFSQISLPPLDLSAILSQLDLTVSQESMQTLINDLIVGYKAYMQAHPETSIDVLQEQMAAYLQSPEVSQKLQAGIEEILKDNQEPAIKFEQLNALLIEIMAGYEEYANENDYLLPSQIYENFYNFLQSEEAKAILAKDLKELIQASNLEEQITAIMQDYMTEAMGTISSNMQEILAANMTDLSTSIANAFYFDADVFAQAIEMNMTEEDLAELMASMMSKDYASYDNNLRQLNYANLDKPSGISIYPKDFESKTFVLNILDEYNQTMETSGQEDKIITYTDIVGTLMSSVTDIVNVISYVLVAFVAISLIVSSIMIGVITYISVLERKKEIGILRAIGASKRNISQVFNAETLIIGLCAGVIGIGITLLLLIPGNQIIHSVAGNNDVNARLPFVAGIILILLSTILTLIGGIIPSRKAAKEDPVTALRNE